MARQLLAAVPELARLRLSSLDPSEIDEELWALLADEPRLMPHLHLSLQAGDDLILKRMKRRHSRAQAIAAARRARALRPEIAIGADLIAGFPTENEAMFQRSLDLVEECGIAFLHVFPVQPARRHAGGADAAARPGARARARRAAARGRRGGAGGRAGARASAATATVLIETPGPRPHRVLRVGRVAARPGRVDRRMRFAARGRKLVGVPAHEVLAARRADDAAADTETLRRIAEPQPEPRRRAAGSAGCAPGCRAARRALTEGINTIFPRRRLDDAALDELEELLIASDMGIGVAERGGRGAAPHPLQPGGLARGGARRARRGGRRGWSSR